MAPRSKPNTPQSILNRLGQGFNKFVQPMQVNVLSHVRNKRAEAILRRLAKPVVKQLIPNDQTQVKVKAGGLETNVYQSQESNSKGNTRTNHEMSFQRDTLDPYQGYEARSDSRPGPNKVRQANVKAQIAKVLEEVKKGDRISADAYDGDGKDKGRAGLYKRVTKGALTADEFGYMSATRLDNKDKWLSTTQPGDWNARNFKRWDPKTLKQDLVNLAGGSIVRRLATHPLAQAAIQADEVIGGITGTKPSTKTAAEFRNTTQRAIEERLKRNQRFGNPLGSMPY